MESFLLALKKSLWFPQFKKKKNPYRNCLKLTTYTWRECIYPPAMHRQFCTNTKTFFHLVLSLFTCYCYKSLRQFTASILWEKNVFLMCLHIYQKRIQRGQGSLSTIDMINSQGISVALHQVQAFALLKKKNNKKANKQTKKHKIWSRNRETYSRQRGVFDFFTTSWHHDGKKTKVDQNYLHTKNSRYLYSMFTPTYKTCLFNSFP